MERDEDIILESQPSEIDHNKIVIKQEPDLPEEPEEDSAKGDDAKMNEEVKDVEVESETLKTQQQETDQIK